MTPDSFSAGFTTRHLETSKGFMHAAASGIIAAEEFSARARELTKLHDVELQAEEMRFNAQAEAAVILEQAKLDAGAEAETYLQKWKEELDQRQKHIINMLGASVATLVESVLKELLCGNQSLPVRATVELAMRVLDTELRHTALCHPDDFFDVAIFSAAHCNSRDQI